LIGRPCGALFLALTTFRGPQAHGSTRTPFGLRRCAVSLACGWVALASCQCNFDDNVRPATERCLASFRTIKLKTRATSTSRPYRKPSLRKPHRAIANSFQSTLARRQCHPGPVGAGASISFRNRRHTRLSHDGPGSHVAPSPLGVRFRPHPLRFTAILQNEPFSSPAFRSVLQWTSIERQRRNWVPTPLSAFRSPLSISEER
jgi:hypothetical protein